MYVCIVDVQMESLEILVVNVRQVGMKKEAEF